MGIRSTLVVFVVLLAFLSISVARGRMLRIEKFEELQRRTRALFATESSHNDTFVCAYCRPASRCNGVVPWCPPGDGVPASASPSPSPSTTNDTTAASPTSAPPSNSTG